jgi:hypothetical protein
MTNYSFLHQEERKYTMRLSQCQYHEYHPAQNVGFSLVEDLQSSEYNSDDLAATHMKYH